MSATAPFEDTAPTENPLFNAAATERRSTIAHRVELDRVRQIYARTPAPTVASSVFAALLAWAVYSHSTEAHALLWCGLKQFTFALRWLDYQAFVRRDQKSTDLARWRIRHGIGTTLDGVGWGLLAWIAIPTGDPLLDGALVASLVGVASVGVFTLSSFFAHAMRFALGCLLPLLVIQFGQTGPTPPLIAGGLVIYIGILWFEVAQYEARLVELLRLRFENAAIAEERARALLLAEHSNAAKSRFLATVSHELRTPLNGILGIAQLLPDGGLTSQQQARLAVLKASAQHLQSLLADLLDTSRADVGRLALDPGPVRLATLVQEVTDLLSPLATEKGLAFSAHLGPGLPVAAMLDGPRVKQVLHNLIGNALKFTVQGSVTLSVSASENTLAFDVEDTGPGVPDDIQERIFDPFDQGALDSALRRSGTGLGLTIARQLAQAMGGNVVCLPNSGSGACFRFSARLQSATMAAEPVAISVSDARHRLQGRVLVVEDHPVNLMVTTAMLQQLGLEWREALDGEKALAEIGLGEIDLVLMDCQMPVLDGLEATRRWRAVEAAQGRSRLPIIALTANAVAGDRDACTMAGMDDYLSKPFELDDLRLKLTRFLGARGRPQSATDN